MYMYIPACNAFCLENGISKDTYSYVSWPLCDKISSNSHFRVINKSLIIFSYKKPRADYFAQSVRADHSAFNSSNQMESVTEFGTARYKQLESEDDSALQFSYQSVQRNHNCHRSTHTAPQREQFTAPIVGSEDDPPLVIFTD